VRRARRPVAPLSLVTAGGVELWVERQGSGDDVLFISGLADEGACWVDQVAGLRDVYRITTFDNRGVGRSATPDGPFTIADFAADTIALMDALDLERPHVVGSSMGGAIAQELVLDQPGRVRSLVLNGTWCRGDRFLHEIFRSWIWAAQKADSIRDFLVAVNLWCFAPRIWNDGTMDGWLDAAAESPHPQSVDAFCRSAEALVGHDTADRLGEVRVPTLVTVGELDLVLPERFSRELAGRIEGARLEVIPGAGHQPFQELPDDYNRLLREFWRAV
jgi:pimeloyl-ACP methyl ester carboxylesterase